jgi:hypothetical protein
LKHDRPALEEHAPILLEDRHLTERLQRAVLRLVLVAQLQQARPVGEARFLKHPAHAKVAHLPLGKGGTQRKADMDNEVIE